MPHTEKHMQTSISRTGQDYAELHQWINDPVMQCERHDFTRICEHAHEIKAKYGEEGLHEYIEHLRMDMAGKFTGIWGGSETVRDEALDYFGISKKEKTA